MITLKIAIIGEKKYLKALRSALAPSQDERGSSKIYLRGKKLFIVAKAKDATRARAILNSYLRIIQVAEQLR